MACLSQPSECVWLHPAGAPHTHTHTRNLAVTCGASCRPSKASAASDPICDSCPASGTSGQPCLPWPTLHQHSTWRNQAWLLTPRHLLTPPQLLAKGLSLMVVLRRASPPPPHTHVGVRGPAQGQVRHRIRPQQVLAAPAAGGRRRGGGRCGRSRPWRAVSAVQCSAVRGRGGVAWLNTAGGRLGPLWSPSLELWWTGRLRC
jgi:hypothetical protein